MSTENACLNFVNAVAVKLLGDKAYDSSPQVGVSRAGSLVIDRESLHRSDFYKRQIDALGKLEKKLADEQSHAAAAQG